MGRMKYDLGKVHEITLALLSLTSFKNADGVRAWKGQNRETMDRLCSKGYLSDPTSKAKSVVLSEEGEKRSRELFANHFSLKHKILPKQSFLQAPAVNQIPVREGLPTIRPEPAI